MVSKSLKSTLTYISNKDSNSYKDEDFKNYIHKLTIGKTGYV